MKIKSIDWKWHALVAVFFSCALAGFAQKPPVAPNLRDHLGLKAGHWVDQLYGNTFCVYEKSVHRYDFKYYRIASYRRGELFGTFKSFYVDCGLMMVGNYVQKKKKGQISALLDGSYASYHTNGSAFELGQYKKGRKVGIWSIVDSTGKLIETQRWKNGELRVPDHGVKNLYRIGERGGFLSTRLYYRDDLLICRVSYDSKGNVEDSTSYCYSKKKGRHSYKANQWLKFPDNGGIAVHRAFDDNCTDSLISETCFTAEGTPMECSEFARKVSERVFPYDQVAIQAFLEVKPFPSNQEINKRIKYPNLLRKTGISDKFYVRIHIHENGGIKSYFVDGNTSELFIKEIDQYMDEIRFEPPTWNGVSFPYFVWLPFDFKLR